MTDDEKEEIQAVVEEEIYAIFREVEGSAAGLSPIKEVASRVIEVLGKRSLARKSPPRTPGSGGQYHQQ